MWYESKNWNLQEFQTLFETRKEAIRTKRLWYSNLRIISSQVCNILEPIFECGADGVLCVHQSLNENMHWVFSTSTWTRFILGVGRWSGVGGMVRVGCSLLCFYNMVCQSWLVFDGCIYLCPVLFGPSEMKHSTWSLSFNWICIIFWCLSYNPKILWLVGSVCMYADPVLKICRLETTKVSNLVFSGKSAVKKLTIVGYFG